MQESFYVSYLSCSDHDKVFELLGRPFILSNKEVTCYGDKVTLNIVTFGAVMFCILSCVLIAWKM